MVLGDRAQVLRDRGRGARRRLTAEQRWAWPSGNWGSLPIAGGLEAASRRDLEAAEASGGPEARAALRADIDTRLSAVLSPFRSAERFSIEEVVDPRDTRRILCAWAANAARVVAQDVAAGPAVRLRGYRP